MAEKTMVQWQNSYSVGVKLVDDQHMELIRLTNKLFINCLAGPERSKNSFLDVIHEVVDYVSYHFGTEEKVMERVKYPEFAEHKCEHLLFVREVFNRVDDYSSGKLLAPLEFVYFLRDWVLHHIAMCDKKVGEYLIAMQRSGELQKITVRVREDELTHRVQIR